MLYSSRSVAVLLSISIAVITTAFLSLMENTSPLILTVAFLISSSASYLLISVVLEFLIFKEINSIYTMLDKLKKKKFSSADISSSKNPLNPLRKINKEISDYASIKQQEIDELKRMAAFRREFLADVSHELKTPIFAAQGFVYTLLDGADEDPVIRKKFLKKAANSLDGLNYLVQDLITLSHIEAGEISMHKEGFDIVSLCHEVIDQLEHKAERKGIQLSFDQEYDDEIIVFADMERIYRVMINLVSNAIKYSDADEGKQVVVGFLARKKEVEIFVKDQGQGISPDHLGRIFERFYRIDKSRNKQSGGSGLGLAIVKHIVEAHGSTVSVSSTVGKGSTFSFKLKRSEQHAAV